jgi:hypothetical protein
VKNDCGSDSKTLSASVEEPCLAPSVEAVLSPVQGENATHRLSGSVKNIKNKTDITLTVNGNPYEAFSFVPSTGELLATFRFEPGTYSVSVKVKNDCGSDSKSMSAAVEAPCIPPAVDFSLTPVPGEDNIYQLKGIVTNAGGAQNITVTVNGKVQGQVSYTESSGSVSTRLILAPGVNSIKVTVKTNCGEDSAAKSVTIEEERPCGVRINPGNSSWEFCMITPSGTFTRDTLKNTALTYSGRATSLYFMPIAGGGAATVNGKPYELRSGQFYLFTGNITVVLGTKNPGAMGQWSVCITADREPVSGNGNNRPESPCMETDEGGKEKKNGQGGN